MNDFIRCAWSCLLTLTLMGQATADAGITIFNADSLGEGFNDSTAVSPVSGNSGTTLGEQRLIAFQAAATLWAEYLDNTQLITVYAKMDPLSCSPSGGTLGGAGATTAARDFENAPRAATFYPIALAQELAGENLVDYPEIVATFNSEVGSASCLTSQSWWYGIGGNQPANTISFYDTVLHEIAHGLGFYTYVNVNGVRATTGTSQWDDHYMLHLMDSVTGKKWPDMSNSERAVSGSSGQLVWSGSAVTAVNNLITEGKSASGQVKMFAPFSYQEGSSVSHWDIGLSPDELMEPYSTASSINGLTKKLFCDIGWPATGCVVDESEDESSSEEQDEKPFIYRMMNILLPAIDSSSN